MRRDLPNWSTAVHEAGHAVIARVLQFPCGRASVIPDHDEGAAGYAIIADPLVTLRAWDDLAWTERAQGRRARFYGVEVAYRARAMTGMAGAEAELECSAGQGLGDADDRYWIGVALENVPSASDGVAGYERRLRARTRALVGRHRQTVELVARALRDSGSLSANEIDRLVWPDEDDPRSRNMLRLRAVSGVAD
jgi:hypothetical protein